MPHDEEFRQTIIAALNQEPVDQALELVLECMHEMDVDRLIAVQVVMDTIPDRLKPLFERIINLNDQGMTNAQIAALLVKEDAAGVDVGKVIDA